MVKIHKIYHNENEIDKQSIHDLVLKMSGLLYGEGTLEAVHALCFTIGRLGNRFFDLDLKDKEDKFIENTVSLIRLSIKEFRDIEGGEQQDENKNRDINIGVVGE